MYQGWIIAKGGGSYSQQAYFGKTMALGAGIAGSLRTQLLRSGLQGSRRFLATETAGGQHKLIVNFALPHEVSVRSALLSVLSRCCY